MTHIQNEKFSTLGDSREIMDFREMGMRVSRFTFLVENIKVACGVNSFDSGLLLPCIYFTS